jgi:hypothetical protein
LALSIREIVFYDFVRHKSLKKLTPAIAAGISDRLWSMDDIVGLIDSAESEPTKRGSYKPRQPQKRAANFKISHYLGARS